MNHFVSLAFRDKRMHFGVVHGLNTELGASELDELVGGGGEIGGLGELHAGRNG